MKDLDRIIAHCRRDPETASLSLMLVACLYGIFAVLLGMVPADADLSRLGQFLPGFDDADWTGHMMVLVLRLICLGYAIATALGGIGVEGARRLGLLPDIGA